MFRFVRTQNDNKKGKILASYLRPGAGQILADYLPRTMSYGKKLNPSNDLELLLKLHRFYFLGFQAQSRIHLYHIAK